MNISQIENYLYIKLNKVVSNNVFAGSLPSTISSTWNDMVAIDCGNAIIDMDAFGYGTILIFLYAKPINGKKNVKALDKMETALNDVVQNSTSNKYILDFRNRYADYDANRNLHCNIVELIIKIK